MCLENWHFFAMIYEFRDFPGLENALNLTPLPFQVFCDLVQALLLWTNKYLLNMLNIILKDQ